MSAARCSQYPTKAVVSGSIVLGVPDRGGLASLSLALAANLKHNSES